MPAWMQATLRRSLISSDRARWTTKKVGREYKATGTSVDTLTFAGPQSIEGLKRNEERLPEFEGLHHRAIIVP